MLEVWWDLER